MNVVPKKSWNCFHSTVYYSATLTWLDDVIFYLQLMALGLLICYYLTLFTSNSQHSFKYLCLQRRSRKAVQKKSAEHLWYRDYLNTTITGLANVPIRLITVFVGLADNILLLVEFTNSTSFSCYWIQIFW